MTPQDAAPECVAEMANVMRERIEAGQSPLPQSLAGPWGN